MFTDIHHVSFVVADIERMTAFYRDSCGLTVQGGREMRDSPFASRVLGYDDVHIHVVQLGPEGSASRLELLQYVNPAGADGHGPKNALGTGHVCFNVEDLEATYLALKDAGMQFVNPPATELTESGETHKACYAQDPEGNWIELRELSG